MPSDVIPDIECFIPYRGIGAAPSSSHLTPPVRLFAQTAEGASIAASTADERRTPPVSRRRPSCPCSNSACLAAFRATTYGQIRVVLSGRSIGNAVCPPVASWVVEHALVAICSGGKRARGGVRHHPAALSPRRALQVPPSLGSHPRYRPHCRSLADVSSGGKGAVFRTPPTLVLHYAFGGCSATDCITSQMTRATCDKVD